ncbi:amino acid ABC transporter substrate-binding protein [Halomonas saccharevitans]|uniref:Amino acid ABC transporter substrate-binding protein, PAAT family n=1 Tax=Halomonas saccharevitans TaxID=416872 RepID=A0A1I7C6Z8_9GAMM|nr:amino acid ABC transporter substrate-binding protein [Halomonas saccharevitans]SFT95178.1 amino acid ABC transporter substrate-binding protein, PAAT family [Halomonas saccharevitans]
MEMKMKRLGTLLTAAAIGFLTTGTASAQEMGPTLNKIKESGVITIGHRETSVPFSYIGDDQQPVGYTIDICMQIVDEIKNEIGVDELNIKWVPVTPQTRIPLMANGTLNLECGSTTNNLTRQQQVDYAAITYITGTKLLTKKESGIATVEDLAGKPIALAQGTTNERVVKEAIEERGIEDVNVVSVRDHAEGFLALQTDRVDAYSTDDILLYGLIEKARDPETYEVVGDFLSYDPYAIMLPQNDSKFRLVVNRRLAELFRTGEIEKIYSTWFEPMNVPMSDLLRANFKIHALPK